MKAARASHTGIPIALELTLSLAMARNIWPSWQTQSLATVALAVVVVATSGHWRHLRPAPIATIAVLTGVGLLGLTTSIATQADVARDLANALRLCALLAIGLALGTTRSNAVSLARAILWAGLLDAGVHLWDFAMGGGLTVTAVSALRTEVSKSSVTEVLALALLMLGGRMMATGPLSTSARRAALATILSVSIATYFSRTAIFGLVAILVIASLLKARQTSAGSGPPLDAPRQKGVTSPILLITGAAAALASIVFVVAPPTLVQQFLTKAENSIHEILPRPASSRTEITQNYRSYESFKALEAFRQGTDLQHVFGRGWGYPVDLVVDTASSTSDTVRVSAPILHNGYLELLVKTGVVGMIVLAAFVLALMRGSLRASRLPEMAGLLGRISLGALLVMTFAMVAVRGVMNVQTFNGVMILAAASYGFAMSSRKEGDSWNRTSAASFRL
ncbi:O-antigen ligase family protein [Demequina maris]|uniref:O-antigen ligase family protein n=1 Tax=Demequina maris TaxID=1638982 RepID=UPI00146FFA2D|nr:O-antigen ligase family protein [Demequina maris]